MTMTKELTKKMINVMKAYTNGKEIESYLKAKEDNVWVTAPNPSWDWVAFEYRIKPGQDTEYKPYDRVAEVDKNKWVVNKDDNRRLYRIIGVDASDNTILLSSAGWKTMKQLFRHYVYEDGTPCGKPHEKN